MSEVIGGIIIAYDRKFTASYSHISVLESGDAGAVLNLIFYSFPASKLTIERLFYSGDEALFECDDAGRIITVISFSDAFKHGERL